MQYKDGIFSVDVITQGPFISKNTRDQLLLSYSILSAEVHPTISSLEDFEDFIVKPFEDKRRHIIPRLDYVGTILRFVGEKMLILSDKLLSEK